MASERQIAANRLNASKSRGPRTPGGKSKASRNATRHGLFARSICIDGESTARFAALFNALVAELEPETTIEYALVENIAVCRWRMMRLWVLENAAVGLELRRQSGVNDTENAPTRTTLAYSALSDNSRWLDSLSRYESRFDRQISRCLLRLEELRVRRNERKTKDIANAKSPAEPVSEPIS